MFWLEFFSRCFAKKEEEKKKKLLLLLPPFKTSARSCRFCPKILSVIYVRNCDYYSYSRSYKMSRRVELAIWKNCSIFKWNGKKRRRKRSTQTWALERTTSQHWLTEDTATNTTFTTLIKCQLLNAGFWFVSEDPEEDFGKHLDLGLERWLASLRLCATSCALACFLSQTSTACLPTSCGRLCCSPCASCGLPSFGNWNPSSSEGFSPSSSFGWEQGTMGVRCLPSLVTT